MYKGDIMISRESLKDKKRIVIKIGTTTITHEDTGELNLMKMERLVRVLTDIRNQGKEVVLVSSGAIAVGRQAIGLSYKPTERTVKQACAARSSTQSGEDYSFKDNCKYNRSKIS